MATYRQPEDAKSDLQRLLLKAVPRNDLGNKTLNHLADLMELNRYSLTKWVQHGKITPARVKQVVEIGKIKLEEGDPPEGRVTRADFEPFVYKD